MNNAIEHGSPVLFSKIVMAESTALFIVTPLFRALFRKLRVIVWYELGRGGESSFTVMNLRVP